jgi:hypothetical protein
MDSGQTIDFQPRSMSGFLPLKVLFVQHPERVIDLLLLGFLDDTVGFERR